MKKRRIRKIFIIVTVIAIVTCFVLRKTKNYASAYEAPKYSGSVYENKTNKTYYDFIQNEQINRPDAIYEIDATKDYKYIPLEEFDEEVYIDEKEGIKGLYIPETGYLTYKVDVKEAGFYNIAIEYYTVEGRSSSVTKGLMINGQYQFQEANSFTLSRVWEDSFDVASKREEGKHDIKPSQLQKYRWNKETIKDSQGYYDDSYLFYLGRGTNEITLVGEREPVIISKITIFQEETKKSYQEMLTYYQNQGYQKYASSEIVTKVQAESSFEKSAPTLSPVASYTSFKVEPYEKFITRYNTIGGSSWQIAGEWVSWQTEVPADGLYQITIKALQNFSRGKQTSRRLYVNGSIPFRECNNIVFPYDNDWQNITLGSEVGGYWFYLKKGTNEIRLEATIGSYNEAVRIVDEVIADLNWIYRKVIMRTGVNPGKYTDYQLKASIDGLVEAIDRSIRNLDTVINEVINISGERSDLIASLERAKYQLENFVEDEKKIQMGLSELETNITALGTWVSSVASQPLSIDYILVHSENTKLPKATTNFFQKIGHEFIMLIGSYGADTSLKSSVQTDGPTIEVWIMSGRDQSNLLRQLIDESFTMQENINVELKLVTSTVLLPATLSGNGPDVAIGVGQSIPVNWGIRNAVVDMSKFSDFEEFSKQFYPSAITPFTFQNAVYALPDTQDFLVQFVRTDIFEEFGLIDDLGKVKTPTTWDEVIDLLPILQRQYLDYYLPNVTGALSPLMYAMIAQYGGSLYLNDGAESGLMQKETSLAFYDFVNFYRNYGFAVDANFTNRFRTGEMPIGVSNYTLYNTLSVSAPEIRGNWKFSLLPGQKQEDGTINRATTSSATGTIILSQSTKQDAAWKFVKWWLGSYAQSNYGRGMEAILGAAARYPTANIEAFASLPWSGQDYRILEEQRKYAVGVPVVPGDYIVGRYIDNAFRKVINDDINPSDSLFNYHQKINAELARKRKEFGLD